MRTVRTTNLLTASLLLASFLAVPVAAGPPIVPLGQPLVQLDVTLPHEPVAAGTIVPFEYTATFTCPAGLYHPQADHVYFRGQTDHAWASVYLGTTHWTVDSASACTTGSSWTETFNGFIAVDRDGPAFAKARIIIEGESGGSSSHAEGLIVADFSGTIATSETYLHLTIPQGGHATTQLPLRNDANGEVQAHFRFEAAPSDLTTILPPPVIIPTAIGTSDDPNIVQSLEFGADATARMGTHIGILEVVASSLDDPSREAGTLRIPIVVEVTEGHGAADDPTGIEEAPGIGVPLVTVLLAALGVALRRRP